MRFRKLRIAWSVVCGIASVLLIVLWVRSYWWVDQGGNKTSQNLYLGLQAVKGEIDFCYETDPQMLSFLNEGWQFGSLSMDKWNDAIAIGQDKSESPSSFGSLLTGTFEFTNRRVTIPFWFTVLVVIVFAVAPWVTFSRRFSLRTLLIATTVVAVVLGLIVAMV